MVTTLCYRCGGHGLVTDSGGDPADCPECGCAGSVWPPRCTTCGRFGRDGKACATCQPQATCPYCAPDERCALHL